jgi:hypothetical protein
VKLTRDQLQSCTDRAVRFIRDVLNDPGLKILDARDLNVRLCLGEIW